MKGDGPMLVHEIKGRDPLIVHYFRVRDKAPHPVDPDMTACVLEWLVEGADRVRLVRVGAAGPARKYSGLGLEGHIRFGVKFPERWTLSVDAGSVNAKGSIRVVPIHQADFDYSDTSATNTSANAYTYTFFTPPHGAADLLEMLKKHANQRQRIRDYHARSFRPDGGGRPPIPSPYSVLGVAPSASREEIQRAYREKAKETHPDRGGDEKAFIQVQQAYERLR